MGKTPKVTLAGLLLIGGIFAVWLFIVLISGSGTNVTGVEWNFERTGQLGDSFGFLSALMATLAAMFAFQTLEKERSKTERIEEREAKQDEAEKRRESEATFFKLLEFRANIISDIAVRLGSNNIREGTNGLEYIYEQAKSEIMRALEWNHDPQKAYEAVFEKHKNDLGHYFRFSCHIIKFLVTKFDPARQYEYAQIVRAQLSNSEQALIAINCIYGEGKEKFKPLVEDLCLLHNLSSEDISQLRLKGKISDAAFERSAIEIDVENPL